jgi:hypothetical protein
MGNNSESGMVNVSGRSGGGDAPRYFQRNAARAMRASMFDT